MTHLEKLRAAQTLNMTKESSWIPRTVGWLGTKGWRAARAVTPKLLKGPKMSTGPRRAVGWLAQSYGGGAAAVGNAGLRHGKKGGKFFEAMRDLGYKGQNFGTLQRDIIGDQILKPSFGGGGLNPGNWPKWMLKNWTGIALGNSAVGSAYLGPSPLNVFNEAIGALNRPKPVPRLPRPAPQPYYQTNYPRNIR